MVAYGSLGTLYGQSQMFAPAAGGSGLFGGALMNPYMMFGSMVLQGVMAARQARAAAAAQRRQFEENEFQRKWQVQVQNRNIAKANALKWFNNQQIGKAANKQRAEEEFYIRYNWDNQSGAFGQQHQQLQSELMSKLSGRNITSDSGTARALLRSSREQSRNALVGASINAENQLVGAARKQEQALASRDFGYNEPVLFLPGTYAGADPSTAFTTSLIGGVAGAVAGTAAFEADMV